MGSGEDWRKFLFVLNVVTVITCKLAYLDVYFQPCQLVMGPIKVSLLILYQTSPVLFILHLE